MSSMHENPVNNHQTTQDSAGRLQKALTDELHAIVRAQGFDPSEPGAVTSFLQLAGPRPSQLTNRPRDESYKSMPFNFYVLAFRRVTCLLDGLDAVGKTPEKASEIAARLEQGSSHYNGFSQGELALLFHDITGYLHIQNIGPRHNKVCQLYNQRGGYAELMNTAEAESFQGCFAKVDQTWWMENALQFFAYRERLDSQPAFAQSLLDRLKKVLTPSPSVRTSCGDIDYELKQFIEQTPRHHSEVFGNTGNELAKLSIERTKVGFLLERRWTPLDADLLEARISVPGKYTDTEFNSLRSSKQELDAWFEAIDCPVNSSVVIGRTYGEDCLVLRIQYAEYVSKLIPNVVGSLIENNPGIGPLDLRRTLQEPNLKFLGYAHNKLAFFREEGLCLAQAVVEKPESFGLQERLAWLEKTGWLARTAFTLPGPEGDREFFCFRSAEKTPGDYFREIDGIYWIMPEIRARVPAILDEVYAIANGASAIAKPVSAQKENPQWMELDGTFYAQNCFAFRQLAYRYGLQHGVEHAASGFPYYYAFPRKVVDRLGQGGLLVFITKKLPKEQREEMVTKLRKELQALESKFRSGLVDPDPI